MSCFCDCPVLLFFSRSCARVGLMDRYSRYMVQMTCFAQKGSFSGLGQWVKSLNEILPRNTLKVGVTPNKLVHFEVLLTFLPTMTLTLWKSAGLKVSWPHFRLSLMARVLNYVRRSYYMSHWIVAHTVIRMTSTYFSANNAHFENFKSPYLRDNYSYSDVIVHSHRPYSLEWSYMIDVIGDLDLRRKRSNAFSYTLFGFSVPEYTSHLS